VYLFRICNSAEWFAFLGPARNKADAERMLKATIGDWLSEVRVHPLCDPFPTPGNCRRLIR